VGLAALLHGLLPALTVPSRLLSTNTARKRQLSTQYREDISHKTIFPGIEIFLDTYRGASDALYWQSQ
jgi:hypothetical protein